MDFKFGSYGVFGCFKVILSTIVFLTLKPYYLESGVGGSPRCWVIVVA